MKSALNDILVDTNVLVYAFDPRDRPKQDRARELLRELLTSKRAVLSVQCLTEFFRTVRWRLPDPLGPEAALREVANFSRACRILDLTAQTVLIGCDASNRFQMSIWDALIWAAAKINEVPYVLSEDADHGRVIEGVRYLNPFDAGFDSSLLEPTA